MSEIMGLDPLELRRAAGGLERQAQRICSNCRDMTAEVNQVWWKGPDADRFKADWIGRHQSAANRVVQGLYRLAQNLRYEATRQERASI